MSNVVRSSQVTRRQEPSNSPLGLQYDGPDTPVLIRLPDLSAPPTVQSNPPESRGTNELQDEPPAAERQRRRHRVDRSHAALEQKQSRRNRSPKDPKWFEQISRSRFALVTVAIAVVCIAYALIPSEQHQEDAAPQLADPWQDSEAADVPLDDVQVAMPGNDLWPEHEPELPANPVPLQPPAGFDAQQAATHGSAPNWPESGVPMATPSGHSAPIRAGNHSQVSSAAGEVAARAPAQRVAQQPRWPDELQTPRDSSTVPGQQGSPSYETTSPPMNGPSTSPYPGQPQPQFPRAPDGSSGSQPGWSSTGAGGSRVPSASLGGPEVESGSRSFLR